MQEDVLEQTPILNLSPEQNTVKVTLQEVMDEAPTWQTSGEE